MALGFVSIMFLSCSISFFENWFFHFSHHYRQTTRLILIPEEVQGMQLSDFHLKAFLQGFQLKAFVCFLLVSCYLYLQNLEILLPPWKVFYLQNLDAQMFKQFGKQRITEELETLRKSETLMWMKNWRHSHQSFTCSQRSQLSRAKWQSLYWRTTQSR